MIVRFLKINLFICLLFNLTIAFQISEKRIEELAQWFANGMAEYEKEYKNKGKATLSKEYTQTEANIKFLVDVYNYEISKPKNFKRSFFNDYNYWKNNRPPKINSLNDIRKNENALINWIIKIFQIKFNEDPNLSIPPNQASNLPKLLPFVKKILKNERENGNDFVFYHAHSLALGLTYDLFQEIENFINYSSIIFKTGKISNLNPKESIVRYLKSIKTPYKGANQLVNAWQPGWDDHSQNLSTLLLSTNYALFGNIINFGENSFVYFLKSLSLLGSSHQNKWIDQIFNEWQFDPKYKKELNDIYNNFMQSNHGQLLQIFIPKNIVNKFAYLSMYFGFPVNWVGIPKNWNISTLKPYIKKLDGITLANYLNFYRQANFPMQEASRIDELQARILMLPEFFDVKNKIKIFKYTTSEVQEEFGTDYKKGLRYIVAKMLFSYLVKNQNQINKGSDTNFKNLILILSDWSDKKVTNKKNETKPTFEGITKKLSFYAKLINSYNVAVAQKKQKQINELFPKIEQIKKALLTISINIKNDLGQTPLMLNPTIAPIVYAVDKKRAGYIVNAKDYKGKTVMQYLIESPYVDKIYIYQALKNSDLKITDSDIFKIKNKLKNNPAQLNAILKLFNKK